MKNEKLFNRDIAAEEPLLKQNIIYEVNSPRQGVTDLVKKNRSKYYERISESNTAKITAEIFFGDSVLNTTVISESDIYNLNEYEPESESQKDKRGFDRLEDSHVISVLKPIAPYSPAGLMIVEGEYNSFLKDDMESHLIFSSPLRVQKEYWKQSLGILKKAYELKTEMPEELDSMSGFTPMLVEHHSSHLTTQEHPALKTLKYHHGHLIFFGPGTVIRDDWDQYVYKIPNQENLMLRQRKPNLEEFVERVNEGMLQVKFETRSEKPIGYQSTVNMDDVDKFSQLMLRHFERYSKVAKGMESTLRERLGRKSDKFFEGNIIQPGYGMVLLPTSSDEAKLIITPAIVPIGPIELMGIMLKRGPQYSAVIDKDETDMFHAIILESLKE
jgi:hypothetical protein